MEAKFKKNDLVKLGGRGIKVLCQDAFGRTEHYGIAWEDKGSRLNSQPNGWIPVQLLDENAVLVWRDKEAS